MQYIESTNTIINAKQNKQHLQINQQHKQSQSAMLQYRNQTNPIKQ